MTYKLIGLGDQNMPTIIGSIVNVIGEDLYDHSTILWARERSPN